MKKNFAILLSLVVLIASVLGCGSSYSTPAPDTSWFKGGTLHRATMKEWRQATYSNRLATAADFIAATQDVDYGDLAKLKRMASDLEVCISTAGEGGAADNETAAFVSSLCLVQMYPK